ncbi:MAG TPA: sulfite exporter TauE/SafE family protein [Stellaceae bacterium]|jgi:hypothetical protein
MLPLSYPGLAVYAVVLIGAFAVRSAAGFGAVLVAVPLLALVMPLPIAVSVASALTLVTSVRYVSRDWRHIAWRHFAIMMAYTLVGVGLGFYFFSMLDEHVLRRGLAAFLILYSIYVLRTGGVPLPLPVRWHGALAAGTGVLGGLCSALFGGGAGPIYVVYFSVVRLEREVFRATMTMVMLVSSTLRVGGYADFGFYAGPTLTLLAVGLPLIVIGSWLGSHFVTRLNPRVFSLCVGGLVMLSGVALLLR